MDEFNKMSAGDLEKIFFGIFGLPVHEPGKYSKERLALGILAARELQKEGKVQPQKILQNKIQNKCCAIKKIPKLAFSKGHYHYPVCKFDTEETYAKKDCDCNSKMSAHTLKLEALAAGSKGKKKKNSGQTVNESKKTIALDKNKQINKIPQSEAVSKVKEDIAPILNKVAQTEAVSVVKPDIKNVVEVQQDVQEVTPTNQKDDPADVNAFSYSPYVAENYDSNVVKHIVDLAMTQINASLSPCCIVGWFCRDGDSYKANQPGSNYQVKLQLKENDSIFHRHVHLHRPEVDDGKVTLISSKRDQTEATKEATASISPKTEKK